MYVSVFVMRVQWNQCTVHHRIRMKKLLTPRACVLTSGMGAAAQLTFVLCLAVASAFTGPGIRTHARLAQPLRGSRIQEFLAQPLSADRVLREDARENAVQPDGHYSTDKDGHMAELNTPAKKSRRVSALKPSPSLTPLEVVEEQFQALSSGSFSDIEDAFAFVSPKIIEVNKMDATKFQQILESATFDGIIGCPSWNVTATETFDDDHMAVTLKILPAPMPIGCQCFRCTVSGLSDIADMPCYFKWELRRRTTEPYLGCWMLEQMSPALGVTA